MPTPEGHDWHRHHARKRETPPATTPTTHPRRGLRPRAGRRGVGCVPRIVRDSSINTRPLFPMYFHPMMIFSSVKRFFETDFVFVGPVHKAHQNVRQVDGLVSIPHSLNLIPFLNERGNSASPREQPSGYGTRNQWTPSLPLSRLPPGCCTVLPLPCPSP